MGLTEAILRGLLHGLQSPWVIVPAWAIGWFARAWWQVVAGAVVLAVILFAISQIMLQGRLPEGAQVMWWLAPLGLLPPLAHSAAAHWLRLRFGSAPESSGARLGTRLVSAFLGLLIGVALGAFIGFVVGDAYVEWAHVSQFEGGAGYMVIFVFALPGALIGGGAGAALAWWLVGRRWAAPSKT